MTEKRAGGGARRGNGEAAAAGGDRGLRAGQLEAPESGGGGGEGPR